MQYINMAYDAANKSLMSMKHGCVITCNNKFISSGCNNRRNKYNDNIITGNLCSCHAEMDALRNAMKLKLKGKYNSSRKLKLPLRNSLGASTSSSSVKDSRKKYCFRGGKNDND